MLPRERRKLLCTNNSTKWYRKISDTFFTGHLQFRESGNPWDTCRQEVVDWDPNHLDRTHSLYYFILITRPFQTLTWRIWKKRFPRILGDSPSTIWFLSTISPTRSNTKPTQVRRFFLQCLPSHLSPVLAPVLRGHYGHDKFNRDASKMSTVLN